MPLLEQDIDIFFGKISKGKTEGLYEWFQERENNVHEIINSIHNFKTPLGVACENSMLASVTWLLNHGARIDIKSSGSYPLNLALQTENFNHELVNLLIKELEKLDVDDRVLLDENGCGTLTYSISLKDKVVSYTITQQLLALKISPNEDYKNSPLISAIIKGPGNNELIRLLLECNADVLSSGYGFENSLFAAASNEYADAAVMIINKAKNDPADPSQNDIDLLFNPPGSDTLAVFMKKHNQLEFARWLSQWEEKGFENSEQITFKPSPLVKQLDQDCCYIISDYESEESSAAAGGIAVMSGLNTPANAYSDTE